MSEPVNERLKRLRTARGWTRKELAARATIGPQVIGALEAIPETTPYYIEQSRWDRCKPETVVLIATALGVTPHYLKHGEEDPALRDATTDEQIVRLSGEVELHKSEIIRLRRIITTLHRLSDLSC